MIKLTVRQREVIERMGDAIYTPEYVEAWINRNDDVRGNAPAALTAMAAKGFFRAVCLICDEESEVK